MNSAPSSSECAPPVAGAGPSLAARLLGLCMRLTLLPLLRRSTDLPALRRRLRWIDGLVSRSVSGLRRTRVGDLDAEFCGDQTAQRVVLYLHGGGFCFPALRVHRTFLVRLCRELEALGVMPEYRLSPESPFPAALNDCLAAYRALLTCGTESGSVVIAGDSAGGNLVLSLLMRIRDDGLPMPGCAVLISPGTDLAGVGQHESYQRNAERDVLVPVAALPRIVRAYAGDQDPALPALSPLHGQFAGLPPLHFVASQDEVLCDDSRLAAARARAAGVDVELRLWDGMMHTFPLFNALPEGRAARANIVSFALTRTSTNADGIASLRAHLLQHRSPR